MLPRRVYVLRCVQLFVLILAVCTVTSRAQTTSFTYQGKLSDGGGPATGSYDFQFTLWDALSGGTQQPQPSPVTVTKTNVAVSGGVFAVQLDFGATAFPGADRYLEIGVRPTGGGFTILSPRQPINSTPYSLRSLSATTADALSTACVNCVTSAQIQSVQGSQITGPIPVADVPAGSTNYIQSNPSSQQTANFNINGNGALGGTLSANSVGVGTPAPSTPLDLAGTLSVRGSTAPPVAPAGQGRLYFDAALNKFRVSQNGSGFSDLVGSGGGLSGGGTTGFVPLWSNSTALGNSVISQSGSNIVIGTSSASSILDVQNSSGNALMRIRSTGNGSSNLFLDRAAAIVSNSSQVSFYSAGNPDFTMGTSQGSAGN